MFTNHHSLKSRGDSKISTPSSFPGLDDGDVHEGVEVSDEASEPPADVEILSPGLWYHGAQFGVGQST